MILGQLPASELVRRLSGPGLAIRTGPFGMRVKTRLPSVARALSQLYDQHPVLDEDAFCDATFELVAPGGLRRWVRPQVQVRHEGLLLFEPLPQDQAYALLEWTMNWWISSHAHQYLLLHAAVVERGDRAAILPAPPGSGKSTLCAGLVNRGWRLLSDEMAMLDLDQGLVHALARPVSLKNASLDVIRHFVPGAVMSEAVQDTLKGTVAHLKPPHAHIHRMDEPARPRWVVFPRYLAGSAPKWAPRPRAQAMMELGRNAFNYSLLGREGFETLARVVSACECLDFSYSQLDDAIAVFESLAGEP